MAAKGKNVGKYSLKIMGKNREWQNWTGSQKTAEDVLDTFNEYYNNSKYKNEIFCIFEGPLKNGRVLKRLIPGE